VLGDNLRSNGVKRWTVDVWLGADGSLRQVREHAVFYRLHAYQTGFGELYVDYWDFGIELPDLSVPPSWEVLWPESESEPESEPPQPGLRILIDGEESTY
jgi:hypothetical protein